MQGDYTQYRRWYADKSIDRFILASDTSTELNNLITPRSANYTIFVQKLVFYETTESNGKSLSFQDDSSTVKVLGKYFSVTAAAGIPKSLELDFGPAGIALGAGKNLDVIVSAAGIAGSLHVEAYEKLTSTIDLTTANTAN